MQFAFQKGHYTEHSVIQLLDQLIKVLRKTFPYFFYLSTLSVFVKGILHC